MTAPRLVVVQQLGLATAQASRTDPGWIEDCETHLIRALAEIWALRAPQESQAVRDERLARVSAGGEG